MSERAEAKTRCQLCQKDKFCSDAEIESCKGYERWVSEADHKREMDEFGRQNKALAVVCVDLKETNEGLAAENKKHQHLTMVAMRSLLEIKGEKNALSTRNITLEDDLQVLMVENKKLKRDIAYLEIFHEDTLSKREGKGEDK